MGAAAAKQMTQAGDGHMPPVLDSVAGRIMDVDSHEDIPTHRWVEEFGEITREIADAYSKCSMPQSVHVEADDVPINFENVWNVKGPRAPGAIDMRRRIEVMDYQGTYRQLLYPGGLGLISAQIHCRADNPDAFKGMALDEIKSERRSYTRATIDAHNDWCIRKGKLNDRIRPIGILVGETPEDFLIEAKKLVKRGMRALLINSGELLGGKTPAHAIHDPLWAYLADANVPVVLHIGGDGGFMKTEQWRDAAAFEGWKDGGEFTLDPWTLSTFFLAAQNFVTTMVLGGVFERHPRLRFGCAEVSAQWIGPLAENMDLWHANSHKFETIGGGQTLPMKPSEYVRRNIRVSAFDIEPVAKYIRDFGLKEVYCYASDYPHREGGRAPLHEFAKILEPLGPEMIESFFVKNGEWLLPD